SDVPSAHEPGHEHDDPPALREGLERFLRHLGAPPADVLGQLSSRWPEIVGPALAGPTRPVELLDGVLVVMCDDPAWASQISWMDGQIRRRFGQLFEGVEVERVTTRVRP
ncbi:MAG: DUF721 domain-containing protein, partial [Actinomycetota bacterium]